jgi:DNA-binding PadR family transcriptional regulator
MFPERPVPETPLTPIELLTLAGLGTRARYGYELVQSIAAISGDRVEVRPGNLYRVLHRLGERGLVEEASAPEGATGDDPRRQYFRATAEGRRVVADELEMYDRVRRSVAWPDDDPDPVVGDA